MSVRYIYSGLSLLLCLVQNGWSRGSGGNGDPPGGGGGNDWGDGGIPGGGPNDPGWGGDDPPINNLAPRSVPEPGTLALLGVALLGFRFLRRKS